MDKIKIGISSCLLGNPVRYDGGHKLDRFLRDTLGKYTDYVPVCPEFECGLGVPREAMRLEGSPGTPHLITRQTRKDHTDLMVSWARTRVLQLEKENLCGFIFKSDSPSSGMERVKVYNARGIPSKTGIGIFARIFMEYFPLLPVEDEGRLHDPELRENFIERIFTLQRWRAATTAQNKRKTLVDFHMRHKLLLLSHSPKHYTLLGQMVAAQKELPISELFNGYEKLLTEALKIKASARKNVNVLQHMAGYFKKALSPDEKQEILSVIDQYRQGHLPLIVPVTLLNHYVRKFDQSYLKNQVYLRPHPLELQLRNHV